MPKLIADLTSQDNILSDKNTQRSPIRKPCPAAGLMELSRSTCVVLSRPSIARKVFAQKSPLVPDKNDHHQIKNCQHDQAEGMGVAVAVAVELIGNEGAQSEQRQRVSDELFPRQAGDEDRLDETVAENVDGAE